MNIEKIKNFSQDEQILNNIKSCMQENIDKGYHKFIYSDLGYDEKCVDVINAIENILADYKRVLKENEELKKSKITYEKVRDIQEKNKNIVDNEYIPKQIIKDKIEEYKNMLKTCNKAKDIDRIKAINERILELQELLEGDN